MKDFNKYKDAFLTEARAHVGIMISGLLNLEKSPDDPHYFHEIFRSVHTLKSMAAAMNFKSCTKLCHIIEDLLDAIRHNRIQTESCIELFFESFDFIKSDLKSIESTGEELDSSPLVLKLEPILLGKTKKDKIKKLKYKKDSVSTSIEKIQSVDVKVEKLDTLLNLIENLIVNKMKLETLRDQQNNLELTTAVEGLGRIVSELQYNIMQLRMLSISLIFNQFPRIVRDLSKTQNKMVNLIIEGDDIEIDRTVIDIMSESLLHLVRNAIDHGLEPSKERLSKNKPEQGLIKLSAERTKEHVVIKVSDDGRGINFDEIKKSAIDLGLLASDATYEEIESALFSEVSTAKEVTEISGRGLGLNIVKENLESIGGSIQVKSEKDQGTVFIIRIPLSLAVINTLFVKVAERIYAIPVSNIIRLVTLDQENMKSVLNHETIILNSESISVINLSSLFGGNIKPAQKRSIVIVEKENERLGLAIDELIKTEEIVIKPLSSTLRENHFFSGSAIIGSGEMILILDIENLFLFRPAVIKQAALQSFNH